MLNFLLDLAQDVSWDILGPGLRVQNEEPDLAGREPVEVDDAYTSSFAASSHAPAYFAHTSGARDHVPGLRMNRDERYERATLLLGPVVVGEPLEERCSTTVYTGRLYGFAVRVSTG
jgi:hypothetical protein